MTSAPQPWLAGTGPGVGGKRHAPATGRNRDAIAQVLRGQLPPAGLVLEVASGSGEHAVYFAALFPDIDWQPSDPDPAAIASIAAWRDEAKLANLHAPLLLEAEGEWPIAQGRCDPVHQHGAYQPLGRDPRLDGGSRPGAARWWTALPLRSLYPGRRDDRAQQRRIRCSAQGSQSHVGSAGDGGRGCRCRGSGIDS